MSGILYLCATPIGNMEDITYTKLFEQIYKRAEKQFFEEVYNSSKSKELEHDYFSSISSVDFTNSSENP